jgi:hypothetical protein
MYDPPGYVTITYRGLGWLSLSFRIKDERYTFKGKRIAGRD